MADKILVSKKFSLEFRDFLKGALLAVLSTVVPIVQKSLEAGELVFNWNYIITVSLGAFVAYIAKNWLLEPAKVITTYDDNKKATEVGDKIEKENR